MLVEDALTRERWQSYFHKFLNDGREKGSVLGDLEIYDKGHNYSYCRLIEVEEVKEAIHKMHRGGRRGQTRFQ